MISVRTILFPVWGVIISQHKCLHCSFIDTVFMELTWLNESQGCMIYSSGRGIRYPKGLVKKNETREERVLLRDKVKRNVSRFLSRNVDFAVIKKKKRVCILYEPVGIREDNSQWNRSEKNQVGKQEAECLQWASVQLSLKHPLNYRCKALQTASFALNIYRSQLKAEWLCLYLCLNFYILWISEEILINFQKAATECTTSV